MKILIVTEPAPSGIAVQFRICLAVARELSEFAEVHVASTYLHPDRIAELRKVGAVPRVPKGLSHGILARSGSTVAYESLLWAGSWALEGLLGSNSRAMQAVVDSESYDFVLNTTYTIPCRSDLLWMMGSPLDATLKTLAVPNPVVRALKEVGSSSVRLVDRSMLRELFSRSKKAVANCNYNAERWTALGFPIAGVVYSACLEGFDPSTRSPMRDYVLTYLGKETELETISRCVERGVKIVGFGSKMPASLVKMGSEPQKFDFKGRVSHDELTRLYSNALFTALPVTDEPFGEVPLESMACGTPVLTYGRQGQLESIVDGRTGWLVKSSDEFVSRATELWQRRATGIDTQDCLSQAARFSSVNVAQELYRIGASA